MCCFFLSVITLCFSLSFKKKPGLLFQGFLFSFFSEITSNMGLTANLHTIVCMLETNFYHKPVDENVISMMKTIHSIRFPKTLHLYPPEMINYSKPCYIKVPSLMLPTVFWCCVIDFFCWKAISKTHQPVQSCVAFLSSNYCWLVCFLSGGGRGDRKSTKAHSDGDNNRIDSYVSSTIKMSEPFFLLSLSFSFFFFCCCGKNLPLIW